MWLVIDGHFIPGFKSRLFGVRLLTSVDASCFAGYRSVKTPCRSRALMRLLTSVDELVFWQGTAI